MHGVTLALSLEQALNEVSGSLAWSHLDRPVELRMSEGLGFGAVSHTVISWKRMMSMFPSGCIPMPSRTWWLACLECTLAVASAPLSWRCVTGQGTYRLAVGGLPIHVSAGWPQVIPVTALVIGYECCHLAVHFLVCQEDSLHTSDLRRHKKDHKAPHRSPRTPVARHCPLLRMLHVALLHPGCSLTHGDWSQVGMEEHCLLQVRGSV